MKIPANISDSTLLAKAAEAKRAANEAEATYKAYAALIMERNLSGETDIAKVTVTDPYTRVNIDATAIKSDIALGLLHILQNGAYIPVTDRYDKSSHIGHSVRITFK